MKTYRDIPDRCPAPARFFPPFETTNRPAKLSQCPEAVIADSTKRYLDLNRPRRTVAAVAIYNFIRHPILISYLLIVLGTKSIADRDGDRQP